MCVSFHVADDIWFLFSLPPREVGSSRWQRARGLLPKGFAGTVLSLHDLHPTLPPPLPQLCDLTLQCSRHILPSQYVIPGLFPFL